MSEKEHSALRLADGRLNNSKGGGMSETDGSDAAASPLPPWTERALREWLVIESSTKRAVFRDDAKSPDHYIPRDVAEKLLGRDLGGLVWFTSEESEKMRAHPEWRDTEPPMPDAGEFL